MTPTPAAISAKFRSAPKRVRPFATPSFPAGLCPFDINARAFAARPHTTSRAPRRPARLLTTPHTPKILQALKLFPSVRGQDVRLWEVTQYRSDATSATYRVVQIKGGGYDPSNPTIEANLNIQYTSAIAYPTTQIFYSTVGSDTLGDPFIIWLDYVLGLWSVPQTNSAGPVDYATHMCNLFVRLGARGASVLHSSGNDGVGHGNCLVEDSAGKSRVRFLATFPSTCPWVTSVGGTTGYNPEIAASPSLSGRGFSVYFPRPSYQDDAVLTFLSNLGGQYKGLFNPKGRGVPDIALQAMRFPIVLKNRRKKVSGTSCSTPTAAGIIYLLNDYRISNGKPPLAFSMSCCCNTDGFSAVPGWDPVTGLGSLDFERLVAILSR
ncbi:peptidase S8/S53 domain-containing protein [Lactarius sanguifluus]|nr:peptidase S8/S53 domain-containing protein [Lactarius sanguifluus]